MKYIEHKKWKWEGGRDQQDEPEIDERGQWRRKRRNKAK